MKFAYNKDGVLDVYDLTEIEQIEIDEMTEKEKDNPALYDHELCQTCVKGKNQYCKKCTISDSCFHRG